VVFATSEGPNPSAVAWGPLGIEAEASTGLGRLAIEPAGAFHGSADSRETGVVFRPRPGDRVRVDLSLARPGVASDGLVVVQVNWDANTKGRMLDMVSSAAGPATAEPNHGNL
jgi:hypothetical protein